MLEENLAAGFDIGNVLALAGLLLDEFVGNQEAHDIVNDGEAQAVAFGKFALVGSGKAAGVAAIGEVGEHRRIEITIGVKTVAADRETVFSRGVGKRGGAAGAGKAAAIHVELAVKTSGHVFYGGDFDDAAKFAAVLGGKSGGQHAHGIDIVGVEFRGERGRAILRERQAVENILHIVFRAARVQHAVGFVEPAGLLIDEVAEISAGLRSHFLIDGLAPDGIDGAGAAGIDEGGGVGDLNLRGDGRNAKRDRHVQRNFGAKFHEIAPGSKAFGADGEAVDTEGQILRGVAAVESNLKGAMNLIGFAEQFGVGGQGCALRVAHFDAQFSARALAAKRCGCER